MAQALNRHAIVVMAVKLVQPGRLGDIVEGVKRILTDVPEYAALKHSVHIEIETLRNNSFLCLYEGQRYMLTDKGEHFFQQTGISYLIEARRMHLLKETRKRNRARRSGTRDRSLLQ
ncbi:hypothetical protein [Sphingomonas jeddahensis]|uniref:hypothetical protein n=1 Tax=Sphingomonas jeddahensis TaxID=1915074 RepID=UPI001181C270|nr:hypothetical protein [Sphingomonas jeddahensis]